MSSGSPRNLAWVPHSAWTVVLCEADPRQQGGGRFCARRPCGGAPFPLRGITLVQNNRGTTPKMSRAVQLDQQCSLQYAAVTGERTIVSMSSMGGAHKQAREQVASKQDRHASRRTRWLLDKDTRGSRRESLRLNTRKQSGGDEAFAGEQVRRRSLCRPRSARWHSVRPPAAHSAGPSREARAAATPRRRGGPDCPRREHGTGPASQGSRGTPAHPTASARPPAVSSFSSLASARASLLAFSASVSRRAPTAGAP